MFERYTERARQVIVLAKDEARLLKHNYIGTEHLLLGLVREEEGLAARVLAALEIHGDAVRSALRLLVGEGDETPTGQIPFTPRTKKVLELSLREALSLGHNYIGTEHILLGLVREDGGVASRILRDESVTAEVVRNEIIRHLSGPSGIRVNGGWTRQDVEPNQLWEHEGCVYRVVGVIEDPAVILADVRGDRPNQTHVIHSRNFAQFKRLHPEAAT